MARKLTALTKATTIDSSDLIYVVKPNAAVGTRSMGMEKSAFEASLSLGTGGQSRIVSGGVVWTGTGLVYESINLIYEINGVQFIIADNTLITLATADATHPRLDNLYGDDTGALNKVTGTPAATPALPAIDENFQLSLTFALVAAGATVPSNVSIRDVYLEDSGQPTEFDATESTGGARIDTNNVTYPLTGTKDIKTIAAIVNGDTFTLTHSTATTFEDFNYLRLDIKCLANWGNDFIQVRLRDGATQVSSALLNPTTMDVTNTTTTQTITLFNHQFTVPTGVEFNNIVFFNRVNGSSAILYQIDNITINEDPSSTTPTTILAADVEVDTTNFNNNLSAADDTVQKALDTLDEVILGTGDVDGPGSATDNALARFDGTTGKLIQNSVVTASDTGAVAGVTTLDANQVRASKGANVASASALAILNDGNSYNVTGTTTITSINTTGKVGTVIKLRFDGILILTHHATDLILPTGANITTQAGDEVEFLEYAAGDFRCTGYLRADGTALAGAGTGDVVGPASAVDEDIAVFDGTTGKLIKKLAGVTSANVIANNAKVTNVPTALSTGTVTNTTYGITSDGGADDVILAQAVASTSSGVMSGTDKAKLDGIEALADVTDATNVDAAGATMNNDTTLAGNGYFLDEDTMSSDSATKVPSQQSVKAYVDGRTPAASTTVSGIIEIATVAEVQTGTDTTRAVTPDGVAKRADFIMFAIGDETSDLTVGTGKITFDMPNYATTITEVSASVVTAPTGSTAIFDINEAGVSILSTKISIDVSEKTSTTAATPPVISDSAIAANAVMTVDIDQIGSTIAGAGAKIIIYYQRA